MKIKIFTLLATFFLLSNISWGQVGEYRVRKIETITKKIEKPKKHKVIREDNPKREGFFVIPEVKLGFGIQTAGIVGLQGFVGYEFNNHFAFGIGTGIVGDMGAYLNMPLYVSLRGDITKTQIANGVTPYYSLDFGYNIKLTTFGNYYEEYYNQGILFSPEFGIRNNKFYIGTELMITPFHLYYYGTGHNPRFYDKDTNLVFSLKLGYKIPLNNIQKFW